MNWYTAGVILPVIFEFGLLTEKYFKMASSKDCLQFVSEQLSELRECQIKR